MPTASDLYAIAFFVSAAFLVSSWFLVPVAVLGAIVALAGQ